MAEGQQVEQFQTVVPSDRDGVVGGSEMPRWDVTGEVSARREGRAVGFSGSEYRRAGGGMAGCEQPGRESQVKPKPAMRRYTKEYKLQVLKDTDNLPEGQVGAYLRREGLYYGTLKMFREHRQRGLLEEGQPSVAMKGGRGNRPRKSQIQGQIQGQIQKTESDTGASQAGASQAGASQAGASLAQMQRRMAELEKENRKLSHRVRQTEALLELQKKASELLGISLEGLRMGDG